MTNSDVKYKTSAKILCGCIALFLALVVGTVLYQNWPQ